MTLEKVNREHGQEEEEKERHGRSQQACLREAMVVCPELFEGLNESSIYRWSKPKILGTRGLGRPPQFLEATQEHVLLHSIVKHGMPLNESIAKVFCKGEPRDDGLLFETPDYMGEHFSVRVEGLSHRKAGKTEAFKHSDTQKVAGEGPSGVLSMSKHEVPWSRVFNIDETAVRYAPLSEYGWTRLHPPHIPPCAGRLVAWFSDFVSTGCSRTDVSSTFFSDGRLVVCGSETCDF